MAAHMHPDPTHGEDNGIETTRAGYELLATPLLNKGTAFTEAERDAFELHGLLPPTSARSTSRSRAGCRRSASQRPIEKYTFLRDLQDTNETLFYALLAQQPRGDAADRLHARRSARAASGSAEISRKPRGLFLSLPEPRPHRADPGQPALRPGRSDRRHRRRAHPRPRRPGRRRHGHPDRQARALHRLRRHPPGDRRCPSCSTSAPTTRSCWPTRSTSAGGTTACAARSTTTSSSASSRP